MIETYWQQHNCSCCAPLSTGKQELMSQVWLGWHVACNMCPLHSPSLTTWCPHCLVPGYLGSTWRTWRIKHDRWCIRIYRSASQKTTITLATFVALRPLCTKHEWVYLRSELNGKGHNNHQHSTLIWQRSHNKVHRVQCKVDIKMTPVEVQTDKQTNM